MNAFWTIARHDHHFRRDIGTGFPERRDRRGGDSIKHMIALRDLHGEMLLAQCERSEGISRRGNWIE